MASSICSAAGRWGQARGKKRANRPLHAAFPLSESRDSAPDRPGPYARRRGRCARSRRLRIAGSGPCGTLSVVLAPVRCGVSEENNTMSPALASTAMALSAKASLPSISRPGFAHPVRQRSHAMRARHDPRAAVLRRCVGQSDPAGEIGFRLGEGVAIVLMPGESPALFRFLVNRLAPVQPHVGPDQVARQSCEHGRMAECPDGSARAAPDRWRRSCRRRGKRWIRRHRG